MLWKNGYDDNMLLGITLLNVFIGHFSSSWFMYVAHGYHVHFDLYFFIHVLVNLALGLVCFSFLLAITNSGEARVGH